MAEYDYQILRLTSEFYNKYPNPPYCEILQKRNRSYNCLLFETHYDYFVCIPFRSEITHKYAYKFKHSKRSKKHKSGLDYSKMLIIKDASYIENKDSIIDKDEYNEVAININKIQKDALEFLGDYIAHCNGEKLLHSEEFERRYKYSPLKYFHKELGLE